MARWMMPGLKYGIAPETKAGLEELERLTDKLYGAADAWIARDTFGEYSCGYFGAPLNGEKLNTKDDNRPCILRGKGPTPEAAIHDAMTSGCPLMICKMPDGV